MTAVEALVRVMEAIEILDRTLASNAYPNKIIQASERVQRAVTDYAEIRMETTR
jgi:hypothetical protein